MTMPATAFDMYQPQSHKLSDMKLLIVDDEPYNVEILEEILADAGYHNVVGCTDSRQAMELCTLHNPDLILLDLQMPHIDGFEIIAQLKSTPTLRHIPTLVITAQSGHDYRLRALNNGAKDYVIKPFNPNEVLTRIRNLLETQYLHNNLKHQNQELAHVNKTLSELVSIVSHELRTPLTSIKSFVEILKDDGDSLDDESKNQFLGIIDHEADRLSRLISNLLDLQKISAGKMSWKTELVDLVKVAHETVEFFLAAYHEKGLTLELEPDLYSASVMTDADKIRQVLTNLLSNALKFTDSGGVQMNITRVTEWANVVVLSSDENAVDALTLILSQQSVSPSSYKTPAEVLAHLHHCGGNINLLLIDISNDDSGNIGFVETVREKFPSLPIITIVTDEKQTFAQKRKLFQRSSFIKKPIKIDQSRDQIETQISDMIGLSPRTSMIEISINDTGIGIPLNDLSMVFERFHQVDSSHTREQSGTGLGLTICKEIIQHFNGKIWVESETGRGSTFRLILPELQQKKKLGEILIEKGLVTEEQLNNALNDQT